MIYVYIGCITFGIVYSVVSALLGGHGFDHGDADIGDLDGHGNVDSADMPSPFSPVVIASAIATFGAVGIIGKAGFRMTDFASLIVSLGFAGVIGAVIFFGIVKFMYGSQSNSTFSQSDIIGVEAEVITPIPGKGMGEIAYVINGVRHSLPAKSANNEDIAKGAVVNIKDITGNIALVIQKMTIDDLDLLSTNDNYLPRKEKENKNI